MKSKNVTINGEDSIYVILRDVSTYFGLKWYQVKPGILIYNGTEYFLLKQKETM